MAVKWQSSGLGSRCCYENVAAFGWSWGPPAGGDVTREVKGHLGITYPGSLKRPQKRFCFHFSALVNEQIVHFCSFPLIPQESDRLHTKRLKIAKWRKADFLLSLGFYRQSRSAKQPPSFRERKNQDKCLKIRTGKKTRQSRKMLRQSCNLTEWAINHHFSQRLVYYFTVFHLWKSNYCYLSAKTSDQTSAGNVILSNDAFIKQFKFSV